MNDTRWYSKLDAWKDLTAFTGVPADLDENFIVRGKNPPPKLRCAEDTELELRFGIMNHGVVADTIEPDLDGITEMLRMVEGEDTSSPKNDLETQNSEPVIHVISKLNPHVKDFVPMSTRTNGSSDKSHDDNISEVIIKKNDKCSNDYDSEKQKKEAILKEKIKETSKSNTMKDKTEKNVAISALLKLNSKPQGSQCSTPILTCSSSPKPMILHPPEYYENSLPAPTPVTSKDLCSPNKYSQDPIVQESIKKVNSWFEKPVTTTDFVKESLKDKSEIKEVTIKSAASSKPLLEPFTYRRKDKSSSTNSSTYSPLPECVQENSGTGIERDLPKNTSPSERTSQSTEQATPTKNNNSYKPSPLAAEMLEKYRANVKKSEHFDVDPLSNNINTVRKVKKGKKTSVFSYGLNFSRI